MIDDMAMAGLDEIIGIDPGSAEAEKLSPDERDALEEAQQLPSESSADEGTAEPQGDEATPEAAAPEQAEQAPQGDDLPEFMTPEYLERHPADAQRWSQLREQRNDFRRGLKEAQAWNEARAAEVKALQAELDAMKASMRQQTPEPEAQEASLPDPTVDPQGYLMHVEQRAEQRVRMRELDMYERLAKQQHGEEQVEAAFKRFQTLDPQSQQIIKSQPDPWGAMVAEMNRRDMLEQIGTDPNAYRERIKAELREELRAEMAGEPSSAQAEIEGTLQAARPVPPPSSIATAPGVGRNATQQSATWDGPKPLDSVLGSALDR